MKFSAVLTKKQAEEMLVYLGDLFTEVRLLDIEAVKHHVMWKSMDSPMWWRS